MTMLSGTRDSVHKIPINSKRNLSNKIMLIRKMKPWNSKV